MPFYSMDTSFAIGQVKESMIWGFLKPFHPSLWLAILGTFMALLITYLIINWITGSGNASGYLISCLKLAFRQSMDHHTNYKQKKCIFL